MIYLITLAAVLLVVPSLALLGGHTENRHLFMINIISLALGVMLLSLPAAELLGRAFYYLTH